MNEREAIEQAMITQVPWLRRQGALTMVAIMLLIAACLCAGGMDIIAGLWRLLG